MTHKEVIAALRSTPSRSKREPFDTAADMIEAAMDKPVVSNADRIRAMSDEELARWLTNFFWGRTPAKLLDLLKWLQQPADHFREATKTAEE